MAVLTPFPPGTCCGHAPHPPCTPMPLTIGVDDVNDDTMANQTAITNHEVTAAVERITMDQIVVPTEGIGRAATPPPPLRRASQSAREPS